MMDYRRHTFDSSRFAHISELRPLHKAYGPFLGYDEEGNPLYHPNEAGVLSLAGARTGKTSTGVIPNALGLGFRGGPQPPMFLFDPAHQAYDITAAAQPKIGRTPLLFSPERPDQSIKLSIYAHLTPDSPTLAKDCDRAAEDSIDVSQGDNRYWDEATRGLHSCVGHAETLLTGGTTPSAIWSTCQRLNADAQYFEEYLGRVLALPNAPPGLIQELTRLLNFRTRNSEGWGAIMSNLRNSVGWSADPQIQKVVSRESGSVTLEVLFNRKLWPDGKPPLFYCGIASDDRTRLRGLIRAIVSALQHYARQRSDFSIRPYVVCDEASILSGPIIRAAYSTDAKYYQSHFYFQSLKQIVFAAGPEGAEEVLDSAGTVQVFGVRSPEMMDLMSRWLGQFTHSYENAMVREDRRHKMQSALRSILLHEVPLLETWFDAVHEHHQSEQVEPRARDLLTPSEVRTLPADTQIIMTDQQYPIRAKRRRYDLDPRISKKLYRADRFHAKEGSRPGGFFSFLRPRSQG